LGIDHQSVAVPGGDSDTAVPIAVAPSKNRTVQVGPVSPLTSVTRVVNVTTAPNGAGVLLASMLMLDEVLRTP
jgi:hypothetical protein